MKEASLCQPVGLLCGRRDGLRVCPAAIRDQPFAGHSWVVQAGDPAGRRAFTGHPGPQDLHRRRTDPGVVAQGKWGMRGPGPGGWAKETRRGTRTRHGPGTGQARTRHGPGTGRTGAASGSIDPSPGGSGDMRAGDVPVRAGVARPHAIARGPQHPDYAQLLTDPSVGSG
jgi:hypothetical protein